MTNSKDLISVVIPAYNAERFLSATLDSALAQTHQDVEVLVVDDGSTDDTADLVANYVDRDRRVRYIRQDNAGVAAARNHGIELARGRFIAPLDADDLWKEEKLEAQLARFIDDPAIGMVYSWFVRIDTAGRILGPFDFRPRFEGRILPLLVLQSFVHASNPLIRTDLLRAIGGYDASLRERGGQGSEDWKLSCEVASRAIIRGVPRYLVGYRQVEDSMSRDPRRALASHIAAVGDIEGSHPEVPDSAYRWSETTHAVWVGANHARQGQYRTAMSLGWWALRRQLKADRLVLARRPFRRYVKFRLLRAAGRFRSDPTDRLTGQPFASTDLSPADSVPAYPGEAARYRFMTVAAGLE
ncbi:MAG: glycosyltransferase family 2 protein [Acidimicrobiia bacterium]|nr:glycosyltransferase family 2 protein [Acidimicrobiia bacterium]MBT8191899.1 glycosyltransferase family 2 protein [Acidimicrobiia bacterium]NNL12386.1 glycosyltransferase family 2 protein [Acidimicrobiia bacterium]NNL97524.1 glycosyltransferase family 2 protein [Acidimicrobiia bacterium]